MKHKFFVLFAILLLSITSFISCTPADKIDEPVYFNEGHFDSIYVDGISISDDAYGLFDVYVVSSDAPAIEIAYAQKAKDAGYPVYLCDGTDDNEEIQEAIDNPSSNRIILTEGTYNVSSAVNLKSHTSLIGQGQTSIINLAVSMTRLVIPASSSNIEISNVLIQGGDNNTTLIRCLSSADIIIKDITITDGSGVNSAGLYLENCSNVVVDNLDYPSGSINTVIKLEDSTGVSITNCDMLAGYYGIYTNDSGCEYITISNNTLVSSANTYNAIAIYKDASHISIISNVLKGNSTCHSPIAISCGSYITVTGNVVSDCTTATECGIEVEYKSSHGTTQSHDITIDANIVRNCAYGICVRNVDGDGTKIPYNIIITNSIVEGCSTGIYIASGDLVNIIGNSLRNNTVNINASSGTNVSIRENIGYLGIGETKCVIKLADETINNSSVYQDDDELAFAIEANEAYLVEVNLYVDIKTASAFKFKFTIPAGCGGKRSIPGNSNGDWAWTDNMSISAGTANRTMVYQTFGIIENGNTAGTVQMQWAQSIAVAEDTILRTNSNIVITRLK